MTDALGDLVVIGASWGGLAAFSRLLGRLPGDFPIPVVLVQHRGKDSDGLLVELLQECTPLRVGEVEDKEPILPGHVYVAPADYHLLVEPGYFSLTTDPAVRFSRPSIDVTFVSAADAYAWRTVGVVLTGANDDGARGLRHIVDRGGHGVVQDPATAEVRIMPEAALKAVPQARVLTLDGIADALVGDATRGVDRAARAAARPPRDPHVVRPSLTEPERHP